MLNRAGLGRRCSRFYQKGQAGGHYVEHEVNARDEGGKVKRLIQAGGTQRGRSAGRGH